MKLAVVTMDPGRKGVMVSCPHCGRETPRTKSYFGSGKGSFRCNHCYCLYKVRFAGETSDRN